MGVIVEKQDVLFDDKKEITNVQLEEEIYQQINLIKLKDLDVVPLEEIKTNIDFKKMVKFGAEPKNLIRGNQ